MARSRGGAVDGAGIGAQSESVLSMPLPESCAISVTDWRCAGHDTARGTEERSPGHEVVVPRRGAYLRELRGRSEWVDAGTATFAHPLEGYRIRHPLPGGDRCTVFALSTSAAHELLGPAGRFPGTHAPLDGRAYLLHRIALHAACAGSGHPGAVLAAEEYAAAFLAELLQGLNPARPARVGHRERVVHARALIVQRYREPLTLAGIAQACGCSVFHLSREFSRHFGMPIWRCVLRLRLRDALEKILETRDGLAQIGLSAGFASQSHFGDAFRAEFGCPPGRVRRLLPPSLAVLRTRARIR
jgi:AraC family transcriptional regulator